MNTVPLLVIGGYLGAGKTTLVNQLLRKAQGQWRVAVLVNDFGSISIDADLIEGASEDVLALAGGCVCCSFGEDLVGSLQKVAMREPPPDWVLLECSGVGHPGAVARSAALASAVRNEGIVTVVDSAEIAQRCQDPYVGDTVRSQIEAADLLLLNQVDRCQPAALARAQSSLCALNPKAVQVPCERAEVPLHLLFGSVVRALPPPMPEAVPDGRWRHQGQAGQPSADQRFEFFEWKVSGPVDPSALGQTLRDRFPGLVRAKGFVLGLDGQPWRVQLMGQRFAVEAETRVLPSSGRLVCIALRQTKTA